MTDQEKRIARAQAAIKGYDSWGSYEEIISDLLADLMHYVDALRQDREVGDFTFDNLLDTARMHYTHEINEED